MPPHLRPYGVVAGELLEPPTAAPRWRPPDDAGDDRWLVDYLEAHGRSKGNAVIAAGAAAGIAAVRVRAARKRVGVAATPATHGRPAIWSLPAEAVAS